MSEQPTTDPRGTGMHSRIAPTDMVMEVQGFTGPGGVKVVGLRVETPSGSFMFLMPPSLASQTGDQMVAAARSAETGLILPGNGLKV